MPALLDFPRSAWAFSVRFFSLLIGYTVCDRSCQLLENRKLQILNVLRSDFLSPIIPHRPGIPYAVPNESSLILGSLKVKVIPHLPHKVSLSAPSRFVHIPIAFPREWMITKRYFPETMHSK
jgi:hypothetical protein